MTTQYHKIQSIYKRDERGRFIEGEWSRPDIEYLSALEWTWTEKVDGTNIRLILQDGEVRFGGRTERAQLPQGLVDFMTASDYAGGIKRHFADSSAPVVLYGEGFGAKIQKGGGRYGAEQRFVLFDVRVGSWWLDRAAVADVGRALGLPVVPVVGSGSLMEAMAFIEAGFGSTWGAFEAEGVVCRPVVDLQTRAGHRIIVKVKAKDLRRMREAP